MKKCLLFLFFLTQAASAAEDGACRAFMARYSQLSELSPQQGFAYGFDDSLHGPLHTVVTRRRAAGQPVPPLELLDDAKAAHRKASLDLDARSEWTRPGLHANAPSYGSAANPLRLEQLGQASAPVYLVEIDGVKKVFRPATSEHLPGALVSRPGAAPTNTGAARRTAAASIIDQAIGADVVPSSRVVRINGVLGTLSDLVSHPREVGVVQPQMYFAPGKQANWRNVQAMEFLVGDAFSHGHNQLRDANLHTWAIDFDQAFVPGVPRMLPKPKAVTEAVGQAGTEEWIRDREGKLVRAATAFPFGRALPETYSPEFVEGLRTYTPDRIRASLRDHLQPEEIEGVLFRREVLLADIEAKGPGGVLPQSGRFRPGTVMPAVEDAYPFKEIWPRANPLLSANVPVDEMRSSALALTGRARGNQVSAALKKLLEGLSPEEAKHFATEYLLQNSGLSAASAPLRAELIRDLGRSPHSTGRTIELLLDISRGAKLAADEETKSAAEAITEITKRIGSYPPRFEARVAAEDVRRSMLHEPIEKIDPMLPKTNVYRVKLRNGVRGILKPRMEDRPWTAGRFEPNRIAYSRELEAFDLIEKFLGNEAARKSGKSRIWIPETVEVSPVINGKAYGPSSFQAFAEGYMPLDDFIKQNPEVWRQLARSPEWKETKARIMFLDYAQGNVDRLGNKANTAHFLRKLNLANIMVPKDLARPADLKVALIDNAVGRPGIPSFTIDFAPKAEDIPEDLRKVLREFDFAAYEKNARRYLNNEGVQDTIRRIRELRTLVGIPN